MERFVQKWVEKVSKHDTEKVENGSKMEPKWVQQSSIINAKIKVGKKFEKRDAPARFGILPVYRFWVKNGPKR